MTLAEAIFTRTSCRDFLPRPISPVQREQLEKAIHQCSRRSGVRIQLICDRPEPFSAFFTSCGRIKGAANYLVFSGSTDDTDLEEKCGYCGEEIVLTAQTMGLSTCWVGGTYDKEKCMCHLEEGEELICIAAIGYPAPAKEKKHDRKPLEELASGLEDAPQWFRDGMAAVQRAPSAMNRQGYCFTYRRDGTVRVRLSGTGSFALVDLGRRRRLPEGRGGKILRRGALAAGQGRQGVSAGPSQRRALELPQGPRRGQRDRTGDRRPGDPGGDGADSGDPHRLPQAGDLLP